MSDLESLSDSSNHVSKSTTAADNDSSSVFLGHGSRSEVPHSISTDNFEAPSQTGATHTKGTFVGVFCPSFVNIVNIIYYVRLPFVLGKAGGKLTIIGLVVSFILVFITLTSLATFSTNGEIEAGGPYYLISRTIGPKIGSTAGFCLAIASVLGAASAHIGLAETIVSLYSPKHVLPSQIWDVRVIGSLVTLIVAYLSKFGFQIRFLAFFRDHDWTGRVLHWHSVPAAY